MLVEKRGIHPCVQNNKLLKFAVEYEIRELFQYLLKRTLTLKPLLLCDTLLRISSSLLTMNNFKNTLRLLKEYNYDRATEVVYISVASKGEALIWRFEVAIKMKRSCTDFVEP